VKPGRTLLAFALLAFLGGALLAPWLYWGAARVDALHTLAAKPFQRYVTRSVMVLAVLGLWPLLRALRVPSREVVQAPGTATLSAGPAPAFPLASRSSRLVSLGAFFQDLGWARPRGQGTAVGWGFTLGFASLAMVGVAAVLAGGWRLNFGLPGAVVAAKILGAAVSAVVVAALEETLFRGAILGSLQRGQSARAALLWSSLIYALVHFFQSPITPASVRWFTGLALLPGMLRGLVDWPTLVPGFLSLTLAGIILGRAYQRTGNLYFSFGLHAGWVFWLKFWGVIAGVAPGATAQFWGTSKLIDGWLALLILAAVMVVMEKQTRQKLKHDDVVRMDNVG
jgi:uncharacterized protein